MFLIFICALRVYFVNLCVQIYRSFKHQSLMKNTLYSKSTLVLTFFLFSITYSFAQCEQATAQIDLDANNVKARLRVGGDLWWDSDDGLYVVPNDGSGTSAIFAGGLWMGGIDPAGNLKLSAQTYGSANGSASYWPGPLDDNGDTDSNNCANFDRFWDVRKTDIDAHLADWEDNGVIDNTIPNSILGWPAV